MQPPIPALDPTPIPGPLWIFQVLWLVTFTIHLLLVDLVLGGSLLALVALLRAPATGMREAARLLVGWNGWAIAFAITFGIAPLLFIQVVLGRFFYTATILLAKSWLTLLVLAAAAYYLNYAAKERLRRDRGAAGILAAQALCFLIVAGIQVSIALTHQQPQAWLAVSAQPWVVLGDPTFVPRFLHFVLAAVSVAGAVLAWWSVRPLGRTTAPATAATELSAGTGPSAAGGLSPAAEAMAKLGVRAALFSTALQIADGFWLLLALPHPVLQGLMRGGAATMIPFGFGVLTSLGALMALALAFEPRSKPRLVRHSMELVVVTVILMVVTRHQVRSLYLASARAGERLQFAPQWGMLLLFLAVFLLSLAAAAYALTRAAKDRPSPGEPPA